MTDRKALLATAAAPVAMPGTAEVEFHTARSSELAKQLLDRFGEVIEQFFAQFPDEQITVQEYADRHSGALQAARSLTVGSIAAYCSALDCKIEQVFSITMYDFAAQMSTLMPAKETGEVPS